jgi:glucose/arabinose dehydrogenase
VRRPTATSATSVLFAAVLVFAAGCSSSGEESGPSGHSPSTSASSRPGASSPGMEGTSSPAPTKGSVKVGRTVTKGLKSPWGLARLPGGGLLVSSRDTGKIFRVEVDTGKRTELGSVPGVSPGGEGGLLGIAVAPTYNTDHLVYAYFTTESDNRIARMLYDEKRPVGSRLGAPDTILRGIPKGKVHNGGRIAFGPDGMLYAGTGESGDRRLAQDKKSLGGKILRMTPDGKPAPGNPFAGSVVYSYGHRNVEGLAWDSGKRLWASEFGQNTWDELNLIQRGRNYGWPIVEGRAGRPGYVDPVEQWRPDEASPSGIAYTRGSVWMAALRGQRLWRIPLNGPKPVAEPRSFLEGKYGRLRTVIPDGSGGLWLVTSETDSRGTPRKGDDRILHLKVT